ncbi:MAG: hypothetical protein FWG73_07930, partial [Planctomycetaceae bacterium]|nr:hypothetical protein [Planctomycetaceae bacterium]
MRRNIFADIGYQDFGQALLSYPEIVPHRCNYELKIVNLGDLAVPQVDTSLLEAYPPHPKSVRYAFFDELNAVQKIQAKTKLVFVEELPNNVPIRAVLLQPLRAASALRGEIVPPIFTAASGKGNPKTAIAGMTAVEAAYKRVDRMCRRTGERQ